MFVIGFFFFYLVGRSTWTFLQFIGGLIFNLIKKIFFAIQKKLNKITSRAKAKIMGEEFNSSSDKDKEEVISSSSSSDIETSSSSSSGWLSSSNDSRSEESSNKNKMLNHVESNLEKRVRKEQSKIE